MGKTTKLILLDSLLQENLTDVNIQKQ